jgi:hypothetical protein
MITSAQKLLMARAGAGGGGGGGGSGIQHLGSVTKSGADVGVWNSSAEALDVLSIASPGDLVVIAFSFSRGGRNVRWEGMSFSNIYNQSSQSDPGWFVGYRFVQAGDANPWNDHDDEYWEGLSVVASVFRGVSSFVNSAVAFANIGMPNPPSLTASGGLWIATGHLDDDPVTMTAPVGWELSGAEDRSGSQSSSTAIAYKIAEQTSDDPGGFGGGGNDVWRAVTAVFD